MPAEPDSPMKKPVLPILVAVSLAMPLMAEGASVFRDTGYPTEDKQSLRMEVTELPTFPGALIAQGITEGVVRVLISVDEKGVLTDWLVLAYTNKALADEAVAAIEKWKFEPMLVRGQPVPCQSELVFNFQAKGVVVSLNVTDVLAATLKLRGLYYEYEPCRFSELDRIPKPVLTEAPAYPVELERKGVRGSVTVEFYIDEQGVVRMPAVTKADHIELGALAVDAVRNWRFEPPTRNGRPVLTRVRQRFDFKGKGTSLARGN
ncbi:MAG: TonB family protein [Verrucomicrobia bacterium]|nr:MAG: TonB family protein [Verrucomicrobiota bacterium]